MATKITTDQINAVAAALREIAEACEIASRRMAESGIRETESTNYTSALRGLELVLRLADAVAGSATTHNARQLVGDIKAEMAAVKTSAAKYQASASRTKKKTKGTKDSE